MTQEAQGLDYFKIEGNIAGEDLIKRKIIDDSCIPYQVISRSIRNGQTVIRQLDLSYIAITSVKQFIG